MNPIVSGADRVPAEAAAQISEVRYARLFETARDGILIIDADGGQIIDANPFMTELLGYSHDEYLGKELWEIGLFKDQAMSLAAFRELQEHGYIRYEHLSLQTKNMMEAEVEFVSNVYMEGSRKVAQCNIRDITERRRLERQTHEQAAALADLHRRKDEFLAMLGHELRNPLAPILNAVTLLGRLQDKENPARRHAREIIERQVGQLKHLVDDLLDVSRITTGRIQLRLERIAVNSIVERALETARPIIERQKHALTVWLPPQPIWLDADSARLEQVLVNLLTNAAKYTGEGGHIHLTVEQEADQCVLRVRDTGTGIAPDFLPHIFDLFAQADHSLSRSEGGLGIGLALVQRLVELHRGKVGVCSILGHGSEFTVHLPIAPLEQQSLSTEVHEAKPSGVFLRVLVVDDNVDTADSLALLIETLGHHCRTAYDGMAAVAAVSDCQPNVVLLDIGLPGLDGYEVAKRIRQEPALRNVMLAALTGYGQDTDRELAYAAGFDHHLVKPVDIEMLEQLLATVPKDGDSTRAHP